MGPMCMPFTPSKFYLKVMFLKSIRFEWMGDFPSLKTQVQHLRGYYCLEEAEDREGAIKTGLRLGMQPRKQSTYGRQGSHTTSPVLIYFLWNQNSVDFAEHPQQLTLHTITFSASNRTESSGMRTRVDTTRP